MFKDLFGMSYVKTPPINGPATDAIDHMVPMIPKMRGRCLRGAAYVSICCLLWSWVYRAKPCEKETHPTGW